MLICGALKAILPVMPEEKSILKFDANNGTHRHPFVIYADFEALLTKAGERLGASTEIIHKYHAMSYGFIVKASDDVPKELMEKFDIPQTPIIFRGSEEIDGYRKRSC